MRFADRVAVIVGGSRGIGYAVAQRLLREGATVVITGRSQTTLDDAGDGLGSDRLVGIAGDALDPSHREHVVRAALDGFGRIDLLVNNAAVSPVYGDVLESGESVLGEIMFGNVDTPLRWIRACRPALQDSNGSIVNVASLAGLSTANGLGLYGASKSALIRLSVQLADELSPEIRVNVVAPAVVRTDLIRRRTEEQLEAMGRQYPLGRLGLPSDIAAAVAFLGSDDATWITGQTLVVDGGLSAKRVL